MNFSEAVKKITSLPASRLGLRERGLLVPGYHADIVAFDQAIIMDKATFADPHRFPEGIPHVWVNGIHTIRNGSHTGVMAGMVI